MLPEYIIYDELKRQRKREEVQQDRPQLEIPRYMPYWPEKSEEEGESEERERESDVVIIQM